MKPRLLKALLLVCACLLTLNFFMSHLFGSVLPAMLAALALLGNLVLIGCPLMRAFGFDSPPLLESVAAGLAATTGIFILLAFLQLVTPPVILIYLIAPSVATLAAMMLGKKKWPWAGMATGWHSAGNAALLALALPLVYAALPPTFYDSLVYHLGIPNQILQWGGFQATPNFVYANSSVYYEISLIPALFLGEHVAPLLHFLIGALFIFAVADFAGERLAVRNPEWVALALLSLPMTAFLLASQKNDLPAALFIFLGLKHWPERWKFSAAAWGFALGIKYFSILPLALFALLFFPRNRAEWRRAAAAIAIALAVLAPLFLKNALLTGDPVYPFLYGVFPSPHWDAARQSIMRADVGAIVQRPLDFVRLPYDLSSRSFGYGGFVGPFLLIFLPFLLLDHGRRDRRPLWLGLLILATAPLFTGASRFAYIAFVILVPWAIRAGEQAGLRPLKPLLVAVIFLNLLISFTFLETIFSSQRLLSGRENAEQYLDSRFPANRAFRYANRLLPADSRILLVGETRNSPLKRAYALSTALDYGVVKPYLVSAPDPRIFLARLRGAGFTHMLVSFSELDRLQRHYANLSAGEMLRFRKLCAQLPPLADFGSCYLYDLKSRPLAARENIGPLTSAPE